MNFKESVMSEAPKNLPKRTRILVKDLLFQEKHYLSDTQVDIMSYIFNAFTWAMKVEGHIILTSKKITDDMPRIGLKTLEASLKELEDKGLIEKNVVQVPIWKNARVRGIKITSNGMKYNSSIYTSSHLAMMDTFQKRVEELENELAKLVALNAQNKSENSETSDNSETSEPNENIQTNETQPPVTKPQTSDNSEVECKEAFMEKVRKKFVLSSEPLCNMVEGWHKETTFYINSYGRLSLDTKSIDCEQIKNPSEVNKFWIWLFKNQHRVGKIVDLQKISNKEKELNNKYKNKKIKINKKTRWIEEINAIKGGVSVKIRDKYYNVATIVNPSKEPVIYTYDAFEKLLLQLRLE